MNRRCASITLFPFLALFALTLLMVGAAAADDTWIDQFTDTMLFYQQHGPGTNWQPYLDKAATIRDGIATQNEGAVQTAEGELIRMLTVRDYGINDAAAEDLFQMLTTRELEPSHQMPVSVPEGALNTPYDGGPRCLPGGCDYWRDDVFDAGAG